MAKLWAVIKREYLERVQNKWFVIATLFTPVLMAALMLVPVWMVLRGKASARADNIAIIDATGVGLGERVVAELAESDTLAAGGESARAPATAAARPIAVRVVALPALAAAESVATQQVVRRELQGYLVLDTATMAGRTARYAGRNATSMSAVEKLRDAVRSTVITERLARAGVNATLADSITDGRVSLETERITDDGRDTGSANVSMGLGIGLSFVLYGLLIVYGQVILRGVMEEKTTRVAEVVVASVKPDILLAGKVLGVGAVALTQLVAWLASTAVLGSYLLPLVLRMADGLPKQANAGPVDAAEMQAAIVSALDLGMISALLVFFVLGFIFYSSLFAAVGAMVNGEQEAQQAATPVMLLIIASFVFIQPIMMDPNSTLSKVMSWLPFSAPIIMPLRMAMLPLSPFEILASMLGVALACAASIWLAARIYRVGLLMYGKRPSIPELVRWIRHA